MKNPIKLRIWNEKRKSFYYPNKKEIIGISGQGVHLDACGFVQWEYVDQFTGIKTVDGVDVYEGDIMKFEYAPDYVENVQVCFENGSFVLKHANCTEILGNLFWWNLGKVVGNVREKALTEEKSVVV
jgi:hypothetical protein